MAIKEQLGNFYVRNILVFVMTIILIAASAEVDWWWQQGKLGFPNTLVWIWLFGGTLGLCIIFSLLLWYIGDTAQVESKPWKKKFVIVLVLSIIGHNLVFVTYILSLILLIPVVLIFTLTMMCIMPAIVPRPAEQKKQQLYILLMAILFVVPLMGGLSVFINLTWLTPADSFLTTIYWIFIWGFVMPAIYMTLGLGFKMGGGKPREAFNIGFAGILMQYSLLEDFLFYMLQGQALPETWPWLSNFILPLEHIFGHPGVAITTGEMTIWLIIMTIFAVIVLFDIYGKIWDRIRAK
jgi:hypothetical protein